MRQLTPSAPARPAPWAILLAFTLVYLAWGTTYLAIREGVKQFPPGLFGGLRLTAAGGRGSWKVTKESVMRTGITEWTT